MSRNLQGCLCLSIHLCQVRVGDLVSDAGTAQNLGKSDSHEEFSRARDGTTFWESAWVLEVVI